MLRKKYFLALALVMLSSFLADCFVIAQEVETIPFQMVENKPTFNGGDTNEFTKWVNSHIVYPESVKANGTEGRVTLNITIGADGSVKDVSVVRGLDPELDKEAVRVVSSSPKWAPGHQKGVPVNVSFMYPVMFTMPQSNSKHSSVSSNVKSLAGTKQNGIVSISNLSGTIWESVKYGNSYKDKTIEQLQFLDGGRVRMASAMYLDEKLISEGSDIRKYSIVEPSTIRVHFTAVTEKGRYVDSFYDFKLKNDSGNYALVDVTEHYPTHKEPYSLKEIKGGGNPIPVRIVTPEAVDLGLSVKWASFNIGASNPEEVGAFYAWGETESKQVFGWSNYKYGRLSTNAHEDNKFTKYKDFTGMDILRPEDDVAHVKLGGNWRMPTFKEFQELFDESNCSITYGVINGIYGCRITSKKPGFVGRYIFIPASGKYESATKKDNSMCYLWSSSRDMEGFSGAISLGPSGEFLRSIAYWCEGMPVRAVQNK